MKKPILFLLASGFLFSPAFAQQPYTLEQCVDYAIKNNLSIKQAKLSEAVSDAGYQQSRYNLLPSVNGSVNHASNFGRGLDPLTNTYGGTTTNSMSYGLSANADLFGGGQKLHAIKQAKRTLMADQSDVERMQQDVSLNVVSAYLNTLFAQEQVSNLRNQATVSEEQLQSAQKKADAGTITEADLLQFKAQVSTDESSLIQAENQLTIGKLDLKQLLNLGIDQNFDIVQPGNLDWGMDNNKYSAEQVYGDALKINPAIKVAEYNTESAEYGLKAAKSGLYPTLSAGLGINSAYLWDKQLNPFDPIAAATRIPFGTQYKNFLGKYLSATLRVPLFSGFQQRTAIKKARLGYEGALLTEDVTKNQLNKTIAQAVADLQAAEKKFAAQTRTYDSFKKAYEYSQKRFDVGMINSLDLNISKTNYSKAESDVLQAKYDMIFKSKVIDYYLGKKISL